MTKPPIWFWAAIGAGLIWNAQGLGQFAGSLTATADNLVPLGLAPEQAAVMTTYPMWMALVIGLLGGLSGSVLWTLRRALSVLVASLAEYIVLYLGAVTVGVFAVMGPPQVIVLRFVVAITPGQLFLARHANKSAFLA